MNAGRPSGIILFMFEHVSPVFIDGLFFLLAFGLVLFLVPPACRLSVKAGFVDLPGGRKQHEGQVPPVGGLVVFPVVMVLGWFYGLHWSHYGAFYAALALLLFVGALDDRFNVKPRYKFGAQFLAALIIVGPGTAQLSHLGDIFGTGLFALGFMAVPFSVIAVVLLVNAVNLMDGLDGLAGGKGFIALFWLAVCAVTGGAAAGTTGAILILMGALAGFLFYNMRHPFRGRASVFLGDGGSLTLGLALAWFSIYLGKGSAPAVAPISVAWILALPIFDICGQFARRIAEGRHPFDADQDHFHHHFVKAGLSVGQSTAVILVIGFAFGAAGVIGIRAGVPEFVLAYIWIALLFAHIGLSMKPARYRKVIARLLGRRAA